MAFMPSTIESSAPSLATPTVEKPPAMIPWTHSRGELNVGGHSLASSMPKIIYINRYLRRE